MLALRVIYYALVGICLIISGYLTYHGFLTTYKGLTAPFTAVILLGLLGADLLIQRYREGGQSIFWPMVLFGIAAFFSVTSNFNQLYTNFMQNTVTEETVRDQLDIFRTDLIATSDRLSSLPSVENTKEKKALLDQELQNMYNQATDPQRLGCGQRCRDHMDNINAMLITPVTDLGVPPLRSSQAEFDDFFGRFSQLVLENFRGQPGNETYLTIEQINREIDTALDKYNAVDEIIELGGLPVLEDLSRISADIERKANTVLDKSPVEHTKIDPTLGKLGEIVFSLQNGFGEMPNPAATVFSTIAAMIVDIFPIIFALIAFRQETPEDAPVIEDAYI